LSLLPFRALRVFNDLDLIALVGLMAQEMERGTPGHEMLEPLMADWRARLAFYGPGTIDLKLDGVISSGALREQLVSLLAAVESGSMTMRPRLWCLPSSGCEPCW
jgi:hypothetical protein